VSREQAPTGAYYALAVLLLAYILSFVDRNVMAVLIGPIRDDFAISDFQYSLLHGFAFSMFYIVLGLPIARLADRHNRKRIISIGILCWSLMTCLCGLARSFKLLFLARIGVGVGEAALSPPAYSLLGDLFTPERLPRAIAVYSLGITIGGGLAYIIGGTVYEAFARATLPELPGVGSLRPWQWTFIAVGAPGLLIVALLSLLREPPRRDSVGESPSGYSLAEVVGHLRRHGRAYGTVMGALSLLSILGYGTMAWYPEFLIRTFGMGRAEAGSQFGTLFLLAGSAGTLVGGWSVKPLNDRGYSDAPVRLILIVAVLWLPPAALGPLSPSAGWALLAAAPIVFLLNAYFGVAVAGIQLITPNRMRAQVSALLLFLTNLFGLALGPSAVAMLTDFAFADDLALRYSLAALPLLVCPTAALLLVLGLRPYRAALPGTTFV
jgi:MFS family permease